MKLDRLLSVADVERAAARFLPRAVYGFVRGGTEDERTLQANLQAFDAVRFRPRGLAGVAQRSQAVTLWGRRYDSPIGVAPMGVTAICRHDCERALASAATEAGLPFVLSGLSTTPMERIREAAPHFWYQGYLPGDPARIGPLMDRLHHNGVEVLVVTIDTAVGANRENNQRAGFTIPFRASARLFVDGVLHPRWTAQVFLRTLLKDRGIPRFTNVVADPQGFRITEEPQGGFRQGRDRLDWSHLEWMRARWPGRIVLKGVAHPDDARAAVRSGLDGVIVSNHGGRQLDGVEASFDALRAIVPAVPQGFPVMVDGGFRRGTHVLKAIALGARLVFLGRPMLYGATVAGPRGVARVIEILKSEIDRDLALLGCRSLDQLDCTYLAMGDDGPHGPSTGPAVAADPAAGH